MEITTRTIHGRLLLRPSPELNDLLLGILGRAQFIYRIEIHAFVAMSNHMHLLVTARDACQLAGFMAFVNGNIARRAGRLHGWRERFWGRRYRAIGVADEASQVGRLQYILKNGVKEGLVSSPRLWPGCSSAVALTTGASLLGTWYDRTSGRRSARSGGPQDARAIPYPVTLSPLPCWRYLSVAEQRQACCALVADIEAAAAAERAGGGQAPDSLDRLLRAHPHDLPANFESSPAPLVHAATVAARQAFRAAYRAFVDAYRLAASRLKRGEPGVEFPLAAFPPALPFVAEVAIAGG